MDNRKLVLYLIGAFILYKLFVSKEGFALGTDVITDSTKLDPRLLYYMGFRKTSNTKTPAINGGASCQEFPDVVYKPVPSTPAVCKTTNVTGDNIDDNYIFGFDPNNKPVYIGSYLQKLSTLPTGRWVAVQGQANPDSFLAVRLFQGRVQCLSMDGVNCLWRGTLQDAQNDAVNPPANAALRYTDQVIYSDINNKGWPALGYRAARDAAGLTDAQLVA